MAAQRTEKQWEELAFDYENKGPNSFQAYVLRRLKKHKPQVLVVKVIRANENGVSDLLLCINGEFIAIELKLEYNNPTAKQVEFLQWVCDAGGTCGVAYTWKDVKRILDMGGYDFDAEEKRLQQRQLSS